MLLSSITYYVLYILQLAIIFLLLPSLADAEIVFHDLISTKDETVMLRAKTKEKVFSRGGVGKVVAARSRKLKVVIK